MAEIIAHDLFKVVFQKLADEALKQVVRAQGIHSELKKLGRTLTQIQKLLNDASQKEITDESVKQWLNGLQHLAYDIDDILDDLATEAMHHEFTEEYGTSTRFKVRNLIPTCCKTFSLSTRMHQKLDNINIKLQELEKEKTSLGLSVRDDMISSGNINRRSQTSMVQASSIVGREVEKEALVDKLLLLSDETCDKNFSIVPIVGMGGVGKTTLARLLYDENRVKDHFELMAWVCVSDDFDSFGISKVIFQSVTGENKEFADLNLLQVALVDHLRDKRFLLVLDDVWSESYEDWETLVGPFYESAPGSKIIMTARKEQLLKKLGYNHLNQLQSLSHENAMSLFAQHALGKSNFDSHMTLKPYGESIVKRCDGLPLAVIAIGRLLRTKKVKEEYWSEVLNSEIWRLQDEGGILPALRLSYNDISACLKRLFSYCSLFPKDTLFNKEDLVLLWMAEGFLQQSTPSNSTEEFWGREYFDELLSRSFFQQAPNNESLFVMHDLMNDLATSVAGELFLRLDDQTEKDIRKEALEKYRHMSFVREQYGTYKKFVPFKRAKSLRTFLASSVRVEDSWQKFFLSNKILADLLPELQLLRVLHLGDFQISEVPESIGTLRHLRYLNLSRTKISCLPESVSNLYNLQTLIIFGCDRLTKLPNSFLKLKKLRHLDIRDTQLLDTMPLGIGELKSLQTLSKIIIGNENGFSLTELKNLKNLRGKISIEGLDKVQNAIDARQANFSQKRLSQLEVNWSDQLHADGKEVLEKEVLNELKPRDNNLELLKIGSYGGLEFPNWVGESSFVGLKHVSMLRCKKCISLPPLGQLPLLNELYIQGMDMVKVVGLELLGTSLAFPSLEILSFKDMLRWEKWSTVRGVVFPCLKDLRIENCSNLIEVSLDALTSLRTLKLNGCNVCVLRSLVHIASSVTKLEISDILGLTDEVWGGVRGYLKVVEDLRIEKCNEIRYLWESKAEANMVLVNLRMLKISQCENMVSLGDKEDEDESYGSNFLKSLGMLEIGSCNSMERCILPDSVEKLIIMSCTSIKYVSPVTRGGGGVLKLKYLRIYRCNKLLDKEFGREKMSNRSNMPMLEELHIVGWANLKSIIELNCFVHLNRLRIEYCESLESLPGLQLSNLTSLIIRKCPRMDASFPCGFWPPKLCNLDIGELKKPISEWSPQNFPTSLETLSLCGGPSAEDVIDFSQLSYLLPSSLTFLGIEEFENLESVSTGLKQVSLQSLAIMDCPKMKDLPEILLPSLLGLYIYECPKLKERCCGKGSYYWPLISHIPCILIDTEF